MAKKIVNIMAFNKQGAEDRIKQMLLQVGRKDKNYTLKFLGRKFGFSTYKATIDW
jgi:hypothetical protein